jgi:hypothetical protein
MAVVRRGSIGPDERHKKQALARGAPWRISGAPFSGTASANRPASDRQTAIGTGMSAWYARAVAAVCRDVRPAGYIRSYVESIEAFRSMATLSQLGQPGPLRPAKCLNKRSQLPGVTALGPAASGCQKCVSAIVSAISTWMNTSLRVRPTGPGALN